MQLVFSPGALANLGAAELLLEWTCRVQVAGDKPGERQSGGILMGDGIPKDHLQH